MVGSSVTLADLNRKLWQAHWARVKSEFVEKSGGDGVCMDGKVVCKRCGCGIQVCGFVWDHGSVYHLEGTCPI